MMHDVTTINAPKLSTGLYVVLHQYHTLARPEHVGHSQELITPQSVEISIILFCSFIILRNNLHLERNQAAKTATCKSVYLHRHTNQAAFEPRDFQADSFVRNVFNLY